MTERSGLADRRREKKISDWVIGIAAFYLLSSFLVPLLLPTNTVPELSGRANALDYASTDGFGSWGNNQQDGGSMGHDQAEHGGMFDWSKLDPFSALIYGLGDLNCHQKHYRTWELNGNQMPVCTRDIGILAGVIVGGAIFRRRGVNRWTFRDTLISLLPDEKIESLYYNDRRLYLAFGIIGALLLPVALDGGIQAITSYESNNLKRILTGLPMGIGVGLLFCSIFGAHPKSFEFDAGKVKLPANARLVPQARGEEE